MRLYLRDSPALRHEYESSKMISFPLPRFESFFKADDFSH
jgi:hypothetical protein